MTAWCHGAPGIGLARLRAVKLLSERRNSLMTGVRRAIRATTAQLETLPAEADASPCHGRAGLAETLLYATHVLGDAEHADRAARAWRSSVRRFTELGYAGIGYALLRADDPVTSPPMLLIESAAA
jgi:lantibiotic modifying enzyme